MKKIFILLSVLVILVAGCNTVKPTSRSEMYKGVYDEKPLSILVMPPINKSNKVEIKEYFYSTLSVPLSDAGYYVIPPFFAMEILKQESAYDAELFLDRSLSQMNEVFGADVVLFTTIYRWEKRPLLHQVVVEVDYMFKSTHTNEVIYTRRGTITYDTSVKSGGGGLVGLAASLAANAINTAVTSSVNVARKCNDYTFLDLPRGKYNEMYGLDTAMSAGTPVFNAVIK